MLSYPCVTEAKSHLRRSTLDAQPLTKKTHVKRSLRPSTISTRSYLTCKKNTITTEDNDHQHPLQSILTIMWPASLQK